MIAYDCHTPHERFLAYVDKKGPRPDQSIPHYRGLHRCWVWKGVIEKATGYGRFWYKGRGLRAHRAALWFFEKKKVGRKYVLHKCDNPSCVNPDHLFLGTAKDNYADALRKGRVKPPSGDDHWTRKHPEKIPTGPNHGTKTKPESRPRGNKHWMNRMPDRVLRGERVAGVKLTASIVVRIREAHARGVTPTVLASRYSVSKANIGCIVARKSWRHL